MPEAAFDDVRFLFDDQRAPADERASRLFEQPLRRITARLGHELGPALAALDDERRRGHYVCGYVAYEAGYVLADNAKFTAVGAQTALPLLDFFVFARCTRLDATGVLAWLSRPGDTGGAPCAVYDIERTETRESYAAKLGVIESLIRNGDTYQVNFTLKYRFGFEGSAVSLYRALRERQRVAFGAYVTLPGFELLSFSPELFVRLDGDRLTSKPMKGTAPRGQGPEDDARWIEHLETDPKTRSENVMIVDLIRSDIGRVAETGSVAVERLFAVETFETVHQLVSTVHGKIGRDTPLAKVFGSLFPCGSITGAPKVRTMEIIRELEAEPRGVYTGALGFAAPDGPFCFSVPIRTLVTRGNRGEMGVGSGVVHESLPDDEFDECVLKARFLTGINASFQLLESMRFDADLGIVTSLDAHCERMAKSATTFGFAFDRSRLDDAVNEAMRGPSSGVHKMRVVLAHDGTLTVRVEPLDEVLPARGAPWVALSERTVRSASCFQRHKTTIRQVYDDEFRVWRERGARDVLFRNERGEVVEASRHNVFVERHGKLVTPPLAAGALPGIARAAALRDPALNAEEGTLFPADLAAAKRIFLTNAVWGIVDVILGDSTAAM